MRVEYIIWHTAAHGNPKTRQIHDTTLEQIDTWHKGNGWNGIGYHYVVRLDGTIQNGRSEGTAGAHVAGLNNKSLGIVFSGHGDIQPLTDAQEEAGINLTIHLLKKYNMTYTRVLGHREVNQLVDAGILGNAYRVSKTCPGKKVDMRNIRLKIKEAMGILNK